MRGSCSLTPESTLKQRNLNAHTSTLRAFGARPLALATLATFCALHLPAAAEGAAKEAAADAAGAGEEGGIKFDLLLKADGISVLKGGIKRGTTGFTNFDAKLSGDLGQISLSDTSFNLRGLSNLGGKSNRNNVGSIMGVDNIEVDTNTAKIFEAWVDQKLPGDVSALFGLYDLNSEFYATTSSALFLNPPAGIGVEMAETGRNGPSIFPTSSVALRLKWAPVRGWYAMAALLDGVPGDPANQRYTQVRFGKGDGTLQILELGRMAESGPISKLGLGVWSYTGSFDDLTDVDGSGAPVKRHNNRGAYVVAEQAVDDQTTGFLRFGVANSGINPVARSVQIGAVSTGMIPGRDEDSVGVSLQAMQLGHKGLQAAAAAGTPLTRSEASLELTWRAPINKNFAVQPFTQAVWHPGADPAVNTAFLIGLRVEIGLGW
jgi:porin